MRRVLMQWVLGSVVAASIGACGGGGCTSGCGGIEPLREGFSPDARIENAGSVRITDSGFRFLETNLGTIASGLVGDGSGSLTFPIDESNGSIDVFVGSVDYTICPGGPTDTPLTCQVELDVGSLNLDFAPNGPHHLTASGPLPIRLQDLPMDTDLGGGSITISGNRVCPGEGPTFAAIDVNVRLSLEVDLDQAHARYGYSKLRIEDVSLDTDQVTDQIALCGGVLLDILDINFIRGFVVDQVAPGLIDTVKSSIEEQLCQKSSADVSCPEGTNDVDGVCRYGTDAESECVSMVLGTDGHAELGSLLASISPGTEGGMDFLLAAGGDGMREDGSGHWGDLDPIGGGATIGMFGGVEPKPVSGCVPLSTLAKPVGIPIPDELRSNTVPGWPAAFPRPDSTGPDVGIAISEDFFNYAMSGMYNSGLLCIGITTETIGDLLNTGTVGLFAASMRDLALQRENSPIAIVLRPTTPPRVTFGNGSDLATDPNLKINLDAVAFDFYVWSTDRFLRAFTAKFDLEVPANLEVTPEGLAPVIEDIGVNNPVLENAELLAEDPDQIAQALASLISGQVGTLLAGGIPPIDIAGALDSFGLSLRLPDTQPGVGSAGIRKLTKGSHDFLGIFAGLDTVTAQPSMTSAWLVRRDIDLAGMTAAGRRVGPALSGLSNAPIVVIEAVGTPAEGAEMAPVEFQVKVDHGPWKPFVRETDPARVSEGSTLLQVQDESFRLEGIHTVQVRSRAIGEPFSLSEPESVEVRIDVASPEIFLDDEAGGGFTVDAFDVVSEREDLEARLTFDDGAPGSWIALDEVDAAIRAGSDDADEVTIEVRDEEGNVGSTTRAIGEAKQQIIRGAPRADGNGGCGCSVPGTESQGRGAAALLALGLGAIVLGRRASQRKSGAVRARRDASPASVRPGDDTSTDGAPAPRGGASRRSFRARTAGASLGGYLLRSRSAQILAGLVTIGIGASFSGCSCGDDPDDGKSSSNTSGAGGGGGGEHSCTNCIVLEPGLVGSYTSAAVDGDGTIWVSGYAEANWVQKYSWGDLVVGKWDGSQVDWKVVDGVPSEPEVDGDKFDTGAFRGGQIEPGEDVGLWSSIAVGDDGNPVVAYYDRTNKQLKLAIYADKKWSVDVVDAIPNGDVGRYAKVWLEDGVPMVAYQSISPASAGFVTSKVRIARAGSAGGFQFDEVAIDETTPCNGELCTDGSVCVADTGQCIATTTGCAECGDGEECVAAGAPTCTAVVDKNKLVTYPTAIGDYVTVAKDPAGGVGVAWYDRVNGTLVTARKSGAGWLTQVVDGGDGKDVGIGATLAIGGNNEWHLAYVDGYAESLVYARLGADGAVAAIEVVDDGIGTTGAPFPDGKHIVGDDASIHVSSNGEIRISYQDATAGKLRLAIGTPNGNTHTWTRQIIEGNGVGGAFSRLLDTPDGLRVVHWWREGGKEPKGDVDIVTP